MNPELKSRVGTVSLIVPNYNHAKYLPRCLDSLLAQSRVPDEILICDDTSTDNSLEVLEAYASRHSQVRILRNEKNQGVLRTLKRLASEARCEYAMSIGADDECCPGFIEKVMEQAHQHPDAGIIIGRELFRYIGKTTGEPREAESVFGHTCHFSPKDLCSIPAWLEPWLTTGISCAAVYRREALTEVFDITEELGPQADIMHRLIPAAKYGLCIVDVPGIIFHEMAGSYSNQDRSIDFAIRTASNFIRLQAMIRRPAMQPLFPPGLRDALDRVWMARTEKLIYSHLSSLDKLWSEGSSQTFAKLHLPGATTASLLGRAASLVRKIQWRWLLLNLRRRVAEEVAEANKSSALA
jgi:glycosyltransferase involved in cell wall biosynthesis